MATLIRPETAERLDPESREKRDRFWRAVEEIRRQNADKDPDEEMTFITEVVDEVRRERYERARREAQGGC